ALRGGGRSDRLGGRAGGGGERRAGGRVPRRPPARRAAAAGDRGRGRDPAAPGLRTVRTRTPGARPGGEAVAVVRRLAPRGGHAPLPPWRRAGDRGRRRRRGE